MQRNDIYHIIGQNILNSISKDTWANAVLNIEAYKGNYVKYNGSFSDDKDNKYQLNLKNLNLKEMKASIYELMEIMGESNKWNKAVFKLWPTGKFDMQFKWDEERDTERNERLNEYKNKS